MIHHRIPQHGHVELMKHILQALFRFITDFGFDGTLLEVTVPGGESEVGRLEAMCRIPG